MTRECVARGTGCSRRLWQPAAMAAFIASVDELAAAVIRLTLLVHVLVVGLVASVDVTQALTAFLGVRAPSPPLTAACLTIDH